ncbi:hypothetical protein BC834DRAFT_621092 [Gloeopeniophorella convolvens]|nr:hypothetical protein BC834DRAFT_621092 [Gloeopeniophorella convolvens]
MLGGKAGWDLGVALLRRWSDRLYKPPRYIPISDPPLANLPVLSVCLSLDSGQPPLARPDSSKFVPSSAHFPATQQQANGPFLLSPPCNAFPGHSPAVVLTTLASFPLFCAACPSPAGPGCVGRCRPRWSSRPDTREALPRVITCARLAPALPSDPAHPRVPASPPNILAPAGASQGASLHRD